MTVRERWEIVKAGVIISLPPERFCNASNWDQWHGLSHKKFMELFGEEVLSEYQIPTCRQIRRLERMGGDSDDDDDGDDDSDDDDEGGDGGDGGDLVSFISEDDEEADDLDYVPEAAADSDSDSDDSMGVEEEVEALRAGLDDEALMRYCEKMTQLQGDSDEEVPPEGVVETDGLQQNLQTPGASSSNMLRDNLPYVSDSDESI